MKTYPILSSLTLFAILTLSSSSTAGETNSRAIVVGRQKIISELRSSSMELNPSSIDGKKFQCDLFDVTMDASRQTRFRFEFGKIFHMVPRCSRWETETTIYRRGFLNLGKGKISERVCAETKLQEEFFAYTSLSENAVLYSREDAVGLDSILRYYNPYEYSGESRVREAMPQTRETQTRLFFRTKPDGKLQIFGEQVLNQVRAFQVGPDNFAREWNGNGVPMNATASVLDPKRFAVGYIECNEMP